MADLLKKINNHTIVSSVPLALAQRAQWKYLLKSFDNNAYQPKFDFLLVSFSTLVLRHCNEEGLALDVGFDLGLLGRILAKRCLEIQGIDILPDEIKMFARHFPLCVGAIKKFLWHPQNSDFILCSKVLMLVKNVGLALSEMAKFQTPGGVFFWQSSIQTMKVKSV